MGFLCELCRMKVFLTCLKAVDCFIEQYLRSNIVDVLSVIISGAALVFAIRVPKKIAEKQDEIALFEKRFSAYADLLKLNSFAGILSSRQYSFSEKDIRERGAIPVLEIIQLRQQVLYHFEIIFDCELEGKGEKETAQTVLAIMKSIEISIHSLPLLYSEYMPQKGKEANEKIKDIFESVMTLMTEITWPTGSVDDENRTNFVKNMKSFFEKYSELFESKMRL